MKVITEIIANNELYKVGLRCVSKIVLCHNDIGDVIYADIYFDDGDILSVFEIFSVRYHNKNEEVK